MPGHLGPDERVRFAVTQHCYACHLPSVVAFAARPDDNGVATLESSGTQSPVPPPPSLDIDVYAGTNIEEYFLEAWRCRRAGLRRAAMVMARSTLQACFRRYLSPSQRAAYTAEMGSVATLAGEGWRAVGLGVRDFGNQWAHPEGTTSPPTWAEVNESFRRMKSVLQFTAEMERVGHLVPVRESE